MCSGKLLLAFGELLRLPPSIAEHLQAGRFFIAEPCDDSEPPAYSLFLPHLCPGATLADLFPHQSHAAVRLDVSLAPAAVSAPNYNAALCQALLQPTSDAWALASGSALPSGSRHAPAAPAPPRPAAVQPPSDQLASIAPQSEAGERGGSRRRQRRTAGSRAEENDEQDAGTASVAADQPAAAPSLAAVGDGGGAKDERAAKRRKAVAALAGADAQQQQAASHAATGAAQQVAQRSAKGKKLRGADDNAAATAHVAAAAQAPVDAAPHGAAGASAGLEAGTSEPPKPRKKRKNGDGCDMAAAAAHAADAVQTLLAEPPATVMEAAAPTRSSSAQPEGPLVAPSDGRQAQAQTAPHAEVQTAGDELDAGQADKPRAKRKKRQQPEADDGVGCSAAVAAGPEVSAAAVDAGRGVGAEAAAAQVERQAVSKKSARASGAGAAQAAEQVSLKPLPPNTPEHVEVTCRQWKASLHVRSCTVWYQHQAHTARQFEVVCGAAASNNWKASFRVHQDGLKECVMKKWLDDRQLTREALSDLAKNWAAWKAVHPDDAAAAVRAPADGAAAPQAAAASVGVAQALMTPHADSDSDADLTQPPDDGFAVPAARAAPPSSSEEASDDEQHADAAAPTQAQPTSAAAARRLAQHERTDAADMPSSAPLHKEAAPSGKDTGRVAGSGGARPPGAASVGHVTAVPASAVVRHAPRSDTSGSGQSSSSSDDSSEEDSDEAGGAEAAAGSLAGEQTAAAKRPAAAEKEDKTSSSSDDDDESDDESKQQQAPTGAGAGQGAGEAGGQGAGQAGSASSDASESESSDSEPSDDSDSSDEADMPAKGAAASRKGRASQDEEFMGKLRGGHAPNALKDLIGHSIGHNASSAAAGGSASQAAGNARNGVPTGSGTASPDEPEAATPYADRHRPVGKGSGAGSQHGGQQANGAAGRAKQLGKKSVHPDAAAGAGPSKPPTVKAALKNRVGDRLKQFFNTTRTAAGKTALQRMTFDVAFRPAWWPEELPFNSSCLDNLRALNTLNALLDTHGA